MYYVYILQSVKYSYRLYKGYSSNLKDRITAHNQGDCDYTCKYRPWKLIYYSSFIDKKKVTEFEKYLKTASRIAFMRKRLLS